MELKQFNKFDKEKQAEIYFSLSEEEQKSLMEEWTNDKKKHFEILGGMFGIVRIKTYCILCGCVREGIVFWRWDYFNGYNPDDLVCPNCFRQHLEEQEQESILRKIKIIEELNSQEGGNSSQP